MIRPLPLVFISLCGLLAGTLPASGQATDAPAAAELKIVEAVFAKKVASDGKVLEKASEFEPLETIYLKVVFDGAPTTGVLKCQFALGKSEISVDEVRLAGSPAGGKSGPPANYAVFSLKPQDDLDVSADYRAVVMLEGRSLGSFKFAVIEPKDKPEVEPAEPRPRVAAPIAGRGTREIVATLLSGTALVEGVDDNGQVWHGTAWLLDREKRLLVTNDHVASAGLHDSSIGTVKQLQLYFPAYRNGRVIHEKDYYARNVEPISVQVIYGDEEKDLALLQADSLPDDAKPLELADTPVDLGDSLYSLGGIPAGSEGFWIYTSGVVRAVYRRRLATGYTAETVEADMETNQGNSGGPVVNDQGQLVAVVEGHMVSARSVSLYIDLTEVKTFLKEALLLVAPSSVEDFVKRGEHHYNADRLDQSLADFTEILRRDPKHSYALSSRGWIFYDKGDNATSLAAFNAAIEADPTMLYAYRGRAMVRLDNDESELAVADLTHAITNASDKEELADFYNERGVAYARLSETYDAIADFERAIDANPEHAWAHANHGDMLMDLDRYEDALQSLAKAIDLDPKEAEFASLMGMAAHGLGNHEQALKMYSLAIKNDPKVPEYFIEQAKCLAALDRYEDAGRSLRTAIEIDETDDEIQNRVGIVAYGLGAYSLAYGYFHKASELDSENSYYWYNRGQSSFKMRDFDLAHQELNRAIRLMEDHDFYSLRGNVNSIQGRDRDAVHDFERAQEIAPDHFRKYNSKYIRISNATSEPLRVYLQYYTKGTDGQYHWYPQSGGPLYFDFVPGEASGVREGQQVIHGARFKIWAEGQNTGKAYDENKETEYIVSGTVGYLTDEGEPETQVYTFEE